MRIIRKEFFVKRGLSVFTYTSVCVLWPLYSMPGSEKRNHFPPIASSAPPQLLPSQPNGEAVQIFHPTVACSFKSQNNFCIKKAI
jgi:hypothetical protein